MRDRRRVDPCGERFTSPAGRRYVCIRAYHAWSQEGVADHRRRQGKVIEPDRHVFVRVEDPGDDA